MDEHYSSLFEGLTGAERAAIVGALERRDFPSGSILLAEGDAPRDMYVIESGSAEVSIADRHGGAHVVGRVGPGDAVGEMSLLTGQPASATVRATGDVVALALDEQSLHRAAEQHPQIYRNLGALLSRRLARANQRALQVGLDCVTVLREDGAPPLLGFAVACSLAWHTRGAVLLLIVTERPASDELAALAPPPQSGRGGGAGTADIPAPVRGRAQLATVPPSGPFGPGVIGGTVHDLCGRYDHVLVQGQMGVALPTDTRVVRLAGPRDNTAPDTAPGMRPGHTVCAWEPAELARPDGAGVLHVPAPTPIDEEGLRRGILVPVGAHGRAVGWLARDIGRLKVGLALGAGAAKGYAHLGVLRTLDRAGLVADYLAGTSIGAVIASLRAAGYDVDASARIIDEVRTSLFRPTLPTAGLLSSARLRTYLQKVGAGRRFEDLDVPLAILAADLRGKGEVVFRRGPVWPALLASMAIPGIYPPQGIGPYMLVDGGVLNPVPSNVVADMGADVVIAVKLASWLAAPAVEAEARAATSRPPGVVQTILGSIELMQSRITTATAEAATIVVDIDFSGSDPISLRDFSQGRRYVALGEAAAQAALPRIASTLPWLRR